jgi:hypothetical protein
MKKTLLLLAGAALVVAGDSRAASKPTGVRNVGRSSMVASWTAPVGRVSIGS